MVCDTLVFAIIERSSVALETLFMPNSFEDMWATKQRQN